PGRRPGSPPFHFSRAAARAAPSPELFYAAVGSIRVIATRRWAGRAHCRARRSPPHLWHHGGSPANAPPRVLSITRKSTVVRITGVTPHHTPGGVCCAVARRPPCTSTRLHSIADRATACLAPSIRLCLLEHPEIEIV